MYSILIRLIITASLIELGLSVARSGDWSSPTNPIEIQRASKKVLRIDWLPISVFPKEAARFK